MATELRNMKHPQASWTILNDYFHSKFTRGIYKGNEGQKDKQPP